MPGISHPLISPFPLPSPASSLARPSVTFVFHSPLLVRHPFFRYHEVPVSLDLSVLTIRLIGISQSAIDLIPPYRVGCTRTPRRNLHRVCYNDVDRDAVLLQQPPSPTDACHPRRPTHPVTHLSHSSVSTTPSPLNPPFGTAFDYNRNSRATSVQRQYILPRG